MNLMVRQKLVVIGRVRAEAPAWQGDPTDRSDLDPMLSIQRGWQNFSGYETTYYKKMVRLEG
jgi:hypothetical protein